MTKDQAYRQAKKRWGNKAVIRVGPCLSDPRLRESARERLAALRTESEAVEQELKTRFAACDWYQDLMRRKKDLRSKMDRERGEALYERFSVGKTGAMFTEILGSGDTFEEAFAKADTRR